MDGARSARELGRYRPRRMTTAVLGLAVSRPRWTSWVRPAVAEVVGDLPTRSIAVAIDTKRPSLTRCPPESASCRRQ